MAALIGGCYNNMIQDIDTMYFEQSKHLSVNSQHQAIGFKSAIDQVKIRYEQSGNVHLKDCMLSLISIWNRRYGDEQQLEKKLFFHRR